MFTIVVVVMFWFRLVLFGMSWHPQNVLPGGDILFGLTVVCIGTGVNGELLKLLTGLLEQCVGDGVSLHLC